MSTIDYYNENAERFFQETVGVDMNNLYDLFLTLLPEKAKILDAEMPCVPVQFDQSD